MSDDPLDILQEARGLKEEVKIPELTPLQLSIVTAAANGYGRIIVVMLPKDTDTEADKQKLTEQVNDIRSLIEMGLMREISSEYQPEIAKVKEANKRDCIVITSTELTDAMFVGYSEKDAVIN